VGTETKKGGSSTGRVRLVNIYSSNVPYFGGGGGGCWTADTEVQLCLILSALHTLNLCLKEQNLSTSGDLSFHDDHVTTPLRDSVPQVTIML
jgi:hypothetical protein